MKWCCRRRERLWGTRDLPRTVPSAVGRLIQTPRELGLQQPGVIRGSAKIAVVIGRTGPRPGRRRRKEAADEVHG